MKRSSVTAALALLLTFGSFAITATPAAADAPVSESKAMNPITAETTPLTPQQAATQASKEALLGRVQSGASASKSASAPSSPDSITLAYSASVGTYAHQQQTNIYCGPASTQTVERYTRGIEDTQDTIASYQNTNVDGSTIVWRERDGLNHFDFIDPAFFVYEYNQPVDGNDWYGKVRVDIGNFGMPQVVTTAPHDPGALYYLPSWPTAITAGHYIVIYGYNADTYAAGSVSYDDSSGGFGGSTGAYGTSTGEMWYVITKGNAQHDPGWIIW